MKRWFLLCPLALLLVATAFAQPYIGPDLPPGEEPGIPDFSGCPIVECILACPPGAIQENEFCPSLDDETNGGCFMEVPEFTDIQCGDTVCGTAFSRFLIRDTDWYRLVLTEDDTLHVCVTATFPVLLALFAVGPEGTCDTSIVDWDAVFECPCQRVCLTRLLPAGTYYIVVLPAVFNCAEECGAYVLETSCEGDGEQLPNEWDMGDIHACYPTEVMNPAHRITDIAHLGAGIDDEAAPQILNQDEFDDGVTYPNAPWLPCTQVSVQVRVSAGFNYMAYADTGGVLYLNGWKDGNLDCDFCDVLCEGAAPEWIVQNEIVTPGLRTFSFPDPGVFDLGRYEGRFRWRLSERPLGACETGNAVDVGEVEDYIIDELQLAVSLLGGLTVQPGDAEVSLSWATASETDNDRFELLRDGVRVGAIRGAGTSAARHDYRFTDTGLTNGRTYTYTLVAVDVNGTRDELAVQAATPSLSGAVVTAYALHQNYPNPFNPSTTIAFDLLASGPVSLKVYDLLGRDVATLVSGTLAAGRHVATFDAAALPSGLYLYRIEANGFVAEKKMLLLK